MSVEFQHNFTGSDGTALTATTPDTDTSGDGYTLIRGTKGPQLDGSGNCEYGGTESEEMVTFDVGLADFDVTILATHQNNLEYSIFIFRYVDENNYWQLMISRNDRRLRKYVAGVPTSYQFFGTLLQFEVTHRIVCNGDSIKTYYNGSLEHDRTDSHNETETGMGVLFLSGLTGTVLWNSLDVETISGTVAVARQVPPWDGDSTISSYDLQHKRTVDASWTLVEGIAASHPVTELADGLWQFRTRANNQSDAVKGPWSPIAEKVVLGGSGIYELFDGAASTALTAHSPDIDSSGNGYTLEAGTQGPELDGSGSAVYGGTESLELVSFDVGLADFDLIAKAVHTTNNEFSRLRFRVQDASNYWELMISRNNIRIRKVVAGTPTDTDDFSNLDTTEVEHRILCDGTSIKIYYNGSLVHDLTDSHAQSATEMGLGFASGYAGTVKYNSLLLVAP